MIPIGKKLITTTFLALTMNTYFSDKKSRKRDLIGPGGAVLRQLEDRFNISLDLSQEGRCLIFGPLSSVAKAKHVIMELVSEIEEGGVYEGTVIAIKDFGAIIELLRNKEGLLHVSEITNSTEKHPGGNIGLVKDYLKVGDKIEVLCTKIDHVQGSIKLSRKKLLQMRKETHTGDGSQPISSIREGISIKRGPVETAEETISIENCPLQDLDEHFDSDDHTNGNLTGSDTDVEDEKVSLYDGASEHIETTTSRIEGIWMERYNELKQLKTANGNCTVPTSHTLAGWVKYQRKQYRKGQLSFDRVQRLSDLGFSFSPKGDKESKWEKRFNELKQFNAANGNFTVPKKSLTHKELRRWVAYNRERYRKGLLSDDRTQLLNDLGFTWSSND